MNFIRYGLLTLFMVLLTSNLYGETVSLTIENPLEYTSFTADFDRIFTGISNVNVQVTGYATAKIINCDVIGGGYTLSIPWYMRIELDDNYRAGFTLPVNNEFDLNDDAMPPEGADWTVLEDGRIEVYLDYTYTFYDPNPGCHGGISPPRTLYQMTITVTCESAVATELDTWDSLKALYR